MTVPGPAQCTSDPSVLFPAWQACGFPGVYSAGSPMMGGKDGGATHDDAAVTLPDLASNADMSTPLDMTDGCMPTVVSMNPCSAAEMSCMGHAYGLMCQNGACRCIKDMVQQGQLFNQTSTICTTGLMAAWVMNCGFPWM